MHEIHGEKEGLITVVEGQPLLLASACDVCGQYTFPQKKMCPHCMNSQKMTLHKVGAKGKIAEFTRCHVAPKGFKAPYFMGFVEVEHGLRVTTIIESEEPEAVHTGAPVELVVGPTHTDEHGNDIVGWKYKVVKEEGEANA